MGKISAVPTPSDVLSDSNSDRFGEIRVGVPTSKIVGVIIGVQGRIRLQITTDSDSYTLYVLYYKKKKTDRRPSSLMVGVTFVNSINGV